MTVRLKDSKAIAGIADTAESMAKRLRWAIYVVIRPWLVSHSAKISSLESRMDQAEQRLDDLEGGV
jgi:hypothetical protein